MTLSSWLIFLQILGALSLSPLNFNSNHEFNILQFTDLHFSNDLSTNQATKNLMASLIDKTHPDLVVITGDVVSGEKWDRTPSYYQNAWSDFTSVFTEKEVKYAMIPGDSDLSAGRDSNEILQIDSKTRFALSALLGLSEFTYNVEINSEYQLGPENTPATILWFFESQENGCTYAPDSFGCITETQARFFKTKSSILKNRHGGVPGLAFLHIPLPRYLNMYDNEGYYGTSSGKISCSVNDGGLYEHLIADGKVMAVFAGHDQDNDFRGISDGKIELVYGRKTGFGGPAPRVLQRGARLIKLTESLDSHGKITVDYEHYAVEADGRMSDQKSEFHAPQHQQSTCRSTRNNDEEYTQFLGFGFYLGLGGVLCVVVYLVIKIKREQGDVPYAKSGLDLEKMKHENNDKLPEHQVSVAEIPARQEKNEEYLQGNIEEDMTDRTPTCPTSRTLIGI